MAVGAELYDDTTAAAANMRTIGEFKPRDAPQISPCQRHRSQGSSPEHIARFGLGAAPCYWSITASSDRRIHFHRDIEETVEVRAAASACNFYMCRMGAALYDMRRRCWKCIAVTSLLDAP